MQSKFYDLASRSFLLHYLYCATHGYRFENIERRLKIRMKKSLMLATLAAVILASLTVQSVLACTTRTPGYWKTHGPGSKHADWPTTGTVKVGAVNYDLSIGAQADALMAILWAQPKGDAWIILAQKVIAAQLSILRYPPSTPGNWGKASLFGGYPGGMIGMVADANDLLDDATSYPPGSLGREDVTDLAETIDYWLKYWNEHGL